MSLGLDKTTWKRIAFGDVAKNVNVTVKDPAAAGIDRVIAMEHLDPSELKVSRWGSIEDGTTFTRLVRPGQTLFGKRRAYQRKAAYADFDAICSGDILVFEADMERLLPEFLPFVVQSSRFYDHALGTSAGSLSPRTNWRDLATFEFDLPPLDEQKRIADLLWSAERHRLDVLSARVAAGYVLGEYAETAFGSISTTRPLGSVAMTRSGPSFAASAVSETFAPGSIPVLGIPNTKADGSIDLAGVGYVSGLPSSTGVIDESSLVIIRTNGNRERIGNVYMPPSEAHGYAVSAFQFLMKVFDATSREYVFWFLHQPAVQELMSEAASGSTGLGNLAVKWLNALEMPWPDDPRRRAEVVTDMRRLAQAGDRLQDEVDALRALAAALSTEIFGGRQ